MKETISTEEKLKERIKELTCLYTVGALIRNSDYSNLPELLEAIAVSVHKSIRFPKSAFVEIKVEDVNIAIGKQDEETIFVVSGINVFNNLYGSLKVGYPKLDFSRNSFLEEEKLLLNKVSSEIGNMLERKQINEKEILVRRQIERVDRLSILGEITAGIAHELNTPLANILGFSELLQEHLIKDKKGTEDLQKVINSAIYSREVVKKLMFFSCEMPQEMELTDINPIIKEAIGLLVPNFRKKKLSHKLHFSKDTIELKVDRIQLIQVIFNLLINAIYFSPLNGEILIAVSEINEEVRIKISDQGSGIHATSEENIFNPFYTTKPVGEGSGLGLSVVHGIVRSHKGTIKYESNHPKGTIFTVMFPKKDYHVK